MHRLCTRLPAQEWRDGQIEKHVLVSSPSTTVNPPPHPYSQGRLYGRWDTMYISLLGSLAVLLAATDRARAQGLNASSAAAVVRSSISALPLPQETDSWGSFLAGFAEQEKDPGLLWSTYAPQLYFGVRPRLPKSLSNGLMWLGLNDWEGIQRPSLPSYLSLQA